MMLATLGVFVMAGLAIAGCPGDACGAGKGASAHNCMGCDTAPAKLCAGCVTSSETASLADHMHIERRTIEPWHIGYMSGKVGEDMNELFSKTVGTAMEQELMNDYTHIGTVYPDALMKGYDENTTVYVSFSMPEGAEASAPLKTMRVPGGEYLVIRHWGNYDKLEDTWLAAFSWAEENDYNFADGACFEHYVTDAETTPVEEWLTEIYLPLESGESYDRNHA
jgi:DNA gyrase inhibitor GyrI